MDSDDAGAPFAGAPAGGLREAIAAALAAGDWPWPASVRSDDSFIDGLCELASAFERAGVGELALAAAVADEHAERSAIARVLLHARRVARGSSPHGPPDARARAARPLEARTLAEAFELLAGEGIEDIVMHRRIVAAIAAPPPGVRLHSHRRTAAHDVRLASIRFSDDAAPADKFGAWSAALGADVGAHDAGAGVHVRVAQPASSALAAWFDTLDAGPDVWSWPPPEEPRRLVAPAMTFSASRLNGFVKCPRRWFFEYLCDALDDEGSAAATYGKVFHEALEALHRAIACRQNFPATRSSSAFIWSSISRSSATKRSSHHGWSLRSAACAPARSRRIMRVGCAPKRRIIRCTSRRSNRCSVGRWADTNLSASSTASTARPAAARSPSTIIRRGASRRTRANMSRRCAAAKKPSWRCTTPCAACAGTR